MKKKTYYITTPIYYVNDKPHIGHAYTSLASDIMARFKRLDGHQVYFLTGTDEHGQKISRAAEAKNISPQDFTDSLSSNFKHLAEKMLISNDDFIRTTEERHKKGAIAFWQKLEKGGHIYAGRYKGWYAVRDEAFYGEKELNTAEDGKKYAPSGAEVEWVEEESYFFKLSAFQERLLALYESRPDFILPRSRANEVRRFVEAGLEDLSVSRTGLNWGVPVPNVEGHVMYVWVEALANYISALQWQEKDEDGLFKKFWPANLHMVGKDIVRFHAVYWPAMLMAADLPLPDRIYAHGWWTNEGQKISKSLGNVIDPLALIETFGLDPVRFFLMREISFGQDGNFSEKSLIQRINTELSNDLGNLCQRVMTLVQKNCEAKWPSFDENKLDKEDEEFYEKVLQLPEKAKIFMEKQAFNQALDSIWEVIAESNRYITHKEPWQLAKSDSEAMARVLGLLCDSLRHVAICIQPFMPDSMDIMLTQLGIPQNERQWADLAKKPPFSRPIGVPRPIFLRHPLKND